MKAVLEFNLPEDNHEHECALAGTKSLLLISDILDAIRSAVKYQDGELKGCDYNSLEIMREFIYKLKEERQIPEIY